MSELYAKVKQWKSSIKNIIFYSQFYIFPCNQTKPNTSKHKIETNKLHIMYIYKYRNYTSTKKNERKQKLKLLGYKISKETRTYNNYKANKTPDIQHPLPNAPVIFILFLQTHNRRIRPCGIWSNRCTANRTSSDLGKPRVNTPHVEHVTTSRELSTPLGVFESVKADHAIIVSSKNDVAVAVAVAAVGLGAF